MSLLTTWTQPTTASPEVPRTALHPKHRKRAGFTLTEVLVVVALIAILVAILLTALARVQVKARETTTLGTMQAFANACELFQQDHGTYPGIIPEPFLAANPAMRVSSTQMALLHLMGGYIRNFDGPEYDLEPFSTWNTILTFNNPDDGTTPLRVRINTQRMGDGPIIGGEARAPYFSSAGRDFGPAERVGPGATVPLPIDSNENFRLPDLLDAWGNPIVYLRRQRPAGELVGNNNQFQFRRAGALAYFEPSIQAPGGQGDFSILNQTAAGGLANATNNLARILEHPSLAGTARGAFMLLAAGKDEIYFSSRDGLGTRELPVTDLTSLRNRPAEFISEYDDIVLFRGR